jgi:hypothetical protein
MIFGNTRDHLPRLLCQCGHPAHTPLYCGDHLCVFPTYACHGFAAEDRDQWMALFLPQGSSIFPGGGHIACKRPAIDQSSTRCAPFHVSCMSPLATWRVAQTTPARCFAAYSRVKGASTRPTACGHIAHEFLRFREWLQSLACACGHPTACHSLRADFNGCIVPGCLCSDFSLAASEPVAPAPMQPEGTRRR